MKISFFEEFPNEENLSKLNLLDWKPNLYVASESLDDFKSIRDGLDEGSFDEMIYWPILNESEGYWFSPFSKNNGVKRIFDELRKDDEKVSVMIDAELPTFHNPWLYVSEFFNFFKNKRLIEDFIRDYESVFVSEYYPQGGFTDSIMSFFGLHYGPNIFDCSVIKMMYHSLHNFNEDFVRKELSEGVKEYGSDYLIGLGTIGVGVSGDEDQLSVSQLRKDLSLAEEAVIDEVVIFRLGGLNKEYVSVLEEYI